MSARTVMRGINTSFDEARPFILDGISNQQVVIQSDHHEIHNGVSYKATDVVNVNSTTQKWMFETPGGTDYVHCIFDLAATGEAQYSITEGADRTTGTEIAAINRKRGGTAETSGSTVSRTPTGGTTDGAVTLYTVRDGATGLGSASNIPGSSRGDNEWMLKPSTKYIIAVTTYDNIYVTLRLSWYEHPNAS